MPTCAPRVASCACGERVVEAGAQRQRDDERGGGGEDRERGQRGLDRAGAAQVGARATRAAARGGGGSSHTSRRSIWLASAPGSRSPL